MERNVNFTEKLLLRKISKFQNFDFLNSNLCPGQLWGAPTNADISEF